MILVAKKAFPEPELSCHFFRAGKLYLAAIAFFLD